MFSPLVFKAVNEDLAKLGGGAMMTEGMSCGDAEDEQRECNFVMGKLDDNHFSWTDYVRNVQTTEHHTSRPRPRPHHTSGLPFAHTPQT